MLRIVQDDVIVPVPLEVEHQAREAGDHGVISAFVAGAARDARAGTTYRGTEEYRPEVLSPAAAQEMRRRPAERLREDEDRARSAAAAARAARQAAPVVAPPAPPTPPAPAPLPAPPRAGGN